MEAHAFVRSKVTGKFYDSERPKGVDDWKDLPATNFGKGCGCFTCQEPAKKYHSAEIFCDMWKEQQKRLGVNFKEIDQQIEKVLKSHGRQNLTLQRPVVRQVRSSWAISTVSFMQGQMFVMQTMRILLGAWQQKDEWTTS